MYFSSRKQRHIFNIRKRNPRRMRRMAFSCTSPSIGGGSRAADVRATKCPFASPLPPIRLQPWRPPFPTHPAHGPRRHGPTCAGSRTTTPPAPAVFLPGLSRIKVLILDIPSENQQVIPKTPYNSGRKTFPSRSRHARLDRASPPDPPPPICFISARQSPS